MTPTPAITLGDFHISLDNAHTVRLSDRVQEAARVMDRHNIDQVPVVDADYDGAMVLTRRAIALVDPKARAATDVGDILQAHSNDPDQRLPAKTPLSEASDHLIEYDWVLTTDQNGRPVGLATVGDALKATLTPRNTCCHA